MSVIHLNIGSNISPRHIHISEAIDALRQTFKSSVVTVSELIETEPWGFDSCNRFLNCGVMIETDGPVDPHHILQITRNIEDSLGRGIAHRNADGSYADRALDIDIISIDRIRLDSPSLTLPHPRASLREFVMPPLRTLDPQTANWIATSEE